MLSLGLLAGKNGNICNISGLISSNSFKKIIELFYIKLFAISDCILSHKNMQTKKINKQPCMNVINALAEVKIAY